jgi:O-antigen biosynthesis protein WbqP
MALLSPLFFLCALIVRLGSPGPVLYFSKRVGRGNVFFMMPKFRTMRVDTPQVATHLLVDSSAYLTPAGAFLRRTSLDELPQLWSVWRGEMSLVGPRPALFNQDDLVAMRTLAGVHTLSPGITGWAQINGRDELPLERKVEHFQHSEECLEAWAHESAHSACCIFPCFRARFVHGARAAV